MSQFPSLCVRVNWTLEFSIGIPHMNCSIVVRSKRFLVCNKPAVTAIIATELKQCEFCKEIRPLFLPMTTAFEWCVPWRMFNMANMALIFRPIFNFDHWSWVLKGLKFKTAFAIDFADLFVNIKWNRLTRFWVIVPRNRQTDRQTC